MMTFFKNLKELKTLDRQIQEDRRDLRITRDNIASYFDRHPYKLLAILIGSFVSGFIASFFVKTKHVFKVVNSSFVKTARTVMQLIPVVI